MTEDENPFDPRLEEKVFITKYLLLMLKNLYHDNNKIN